MNCIALHNFQNVEKQHIYARSQQENVECQELHWKVTVPGVPRHKTSKKANEF